MPHADTDAHDEPGHPEEHLQQTSTQGAEPADGPPHKDGGRRDGKRRTDLKRTGEQRETHTPTARATTAPLAQTAARSGRSAADTPRTVRTPSVPPAGPFRSEATRFTAPPSAAPASATQPPGDGRSDCVPSGPAIA